MVSEPELSEQESQDNLQNEQEADNTATGGLSYSITDQTWGEIFRRPAF